MNSGELHVRKALSAAVFLSGSGNVAFGGNLPSWRVLPIPWYGGSEQGQKSVGTAMAAGVIDQQVPNWAQVHRPPGPIFCCASLANDIARLRWCVLPCNSDRLW